MKTLSLKSFAGLILKPNTQSRKSKYGSLRISFRNKIPLPFIQKELQVSLVKKNFEIRSFTVEHDLSIAGEFPKQISEDIPVADVFRHIYKVKEKERGGEPVLLSDLISISNND